MEYVKTRMPHPTRTEMMTPMKRHRLINQHEPSVRNSHVTGRMMLHAGICLTTQAQRPGARDAPIATTTLSPGSLERMVR
jgi:hypothetical protein